MDLTLPRSVQNLLRTGRFDVPSHTLPKREGFVLLRMNCSGILHFGQQGAGPTANEVFMDLTLPRPVRGALRIRSRVWLAKLFIKQHELFEMVFANAVLSPRGRPGVQ